MATRLCPLLRAASNFGNPSDVVDATYTTIGTPTIHAIENSGTNPITFTQFLVGVHYQDVSTATGETMGEFRLRLTWGAGTATVILTETDDLTHSGENHSGTIWVSALSFANNGEFGTGGSKALTVEVYMDATTGTGTNWRGVYATVMYQYTFDNSEANRTHHISYVLESGTGDLTTTANTAFGTISQMTGSGGLLEGYSPTIRQIWAEVSGNINNAGGSTDCNINYSYDGSGSNALPTRVCTLASDTFQTYLIDLSSLDWSSSHTLDLWSSLASRWANLSVIIRVTFTYATADVTKQLVQMEIPVTFQNNTLTGTTSSEAAREQIKFLIPETNPSLKNGGFHGAYVSGSTCTAYVKAGSQGSFRSYAMSASIVAGHFRFLHRIDSGSASGSAITLARGNNTLNIDAYRGTAVSTLAFTGVLHVLYEHDELADQDTSTRTISKNIRTIDFASTTETTLTGIHLSELPSGYWLTALGCWQSCFGLYSGTISVFAELASDEGEQDGWRRLGVQEHSSDGELYYIDILFNATEHFKRHTSDPDPMRVDAEESRRFYWRPTSRAELDWIGVFHTQTTTLSGTVYGSGGGTVNIYVHDANTDEILYTTSRSGSGSYSLDVHNPADDYYVTAHESDTYKGRSKNDVAGSGFDIVLRCGIAATYG